MTTERDSDTEPTVEIQRPVVPQPALEIEDVDQEFDKDFDPERTLVREDWESTAIRRVAPHVAAVQDEVSADDEEPFGWESEALRRLSRVVQNRSGQA
ncbi:MAG TPA: hypothetical protein VFO35_11140 [Steroidobacteraceae bacterium]|nr:hypothetical protein [Steroidobacteraceae bacterium]